MDSSRAVAIAEILYQDSNGYAVSQDGKKNAGLTEDKAFTYGEISFDTFPAILRTAQPKKGVFYDLGSGTGKAVLMATLLGMFHTVRGIELIPELVEESNRIINRFTSTIAPLMASEEPVPDVAIIQDDFFKHDWSDADCIFVQGTCMPSDVVKQLTKKFESLKPGTKIIVASSYLPTNILRLNETANFKLGWGLATLYFYERP